MVENKDTIIIRVSATFNLSSLLDECSPLEDIPLTSAAAANSSAALEDENIIGTKTYSIVSNGFFQEYIFLNLKESTISLNSNFIVGKKRIIKINGNEMFL